MSSFHSPEPKSLHRTSLFSPSRNLNFLYNNQRQDPLRQKALSFAFEPQYLYHPPVRQPVNAQTQTLPTQTESQNSRLIHSNVNDVQNLHHHRICSKQKKQTSTNTYLIDSKKLSHYQPSQIHNEKKLSPSSHFDKTFLKDRIAHFESLRSTIKIHQNPTEPPHSTPTTAQSIQGPKTSLFHNFNESKRLLNKPNNLLHPSYFAKIATTTASSVNSSFEAKNKLKDQKTHHLSDFLSTQKISHLHNLKENVPTFFTLKNKDQNSKRQRKFPSFLTSKVQKKQFTNDERPPFKQFQKIDTSSKKFETQQEEEAVMSLPIKRLFNKKHVKSHSVFQNICCGNRDEFQANEPGNNSGQSGKFKYQMDNCPTERRERSNSIQQENENVDTGLNFRRKNVQKVEEKVFPAKDFLIFRETLDKFNFKGLTIDQNSFKKNGDPVKFTPTHSKKVSFDQPPTFSKTEDLFIKKVDRKNTQKSEQKPAQTVHKTNNLETIDDIKQALINCNLFSEEDYNGVLQNHKKDILKHSNSTAGENMEETKIDPSKLKPSIKNLVDSCTSSESSSSESTEEEKKIAELNSKCQQKRSKWILEQTDTIKQSLKELSEFNTEKSLHQQSEWKKISLNDLNKQKKRCSVQIQNILEINEDNESSILESRDFKLSSAFMLSESECAQLAHRESDVIAFQKRRSYEEEIKLKEGQISNVSMNDFNVRWTAQEHVSNVIGENELTCVLYTVEHKLTRCVYLIKKYDKEALKNSAPSFVLNFIQGIRIQMKLLNHPNIEKIYAVFSDQSSFYTLCEYTETKLSKILTQHEQKPLFKSLQQSIYLNTVTKDSERVELFKEIIDGLQEAHLNNIMHKNFQPNSIKLIWDTCKISCFQGCQIAQKTLSSRISHSYVCPENLFDKAKTAMDIWCLGILAYELLIGKKPFQSNDKTNSTAKKILEVLFSFIQCNFDIPAQKASLCEEVLNMALKRNPKERASIFDIKNTWAIKLKMFSSIFNEHKVIQNKLTPILEG